MYLKKFSQIIVLFVFSSLVFSQEIIMEVKRSEGNVLTKEDVNHYWKMIKKKADKMYSGFDVSVEISTGYSNETSISGGSNYSGEVKLKVPIYSKQEIREKENSKITFLDKGAELIEELEILLSQQVILKEKENFLKAILLEEGVRSIEAYHNVREERMAVDAKISSVIRKIENMLI